MIGNLTHAALALDSYRASDYTYLLSDDGTDRVVYLIDNVVYKVDTTGEGVNLSEIERMASITLPDYVYFPTAALWTVDGEHILAMEYVPGIHVAACLCIEDEEIHDSSCMDARLKDILMALEIDIWGMNVIFNHSGYWIVDAAM